MSIGSGKYDELTTLVREKSAAETAVVIIIKGDLGSGFSIQSIHKNLLFLPGMLRGMADEIERDLKNETHH